jgi:hypothetical protein
MDWGLGDIDSPHYNTSMRMAAIKNQVPSSCAGRPLLLANEPDGGIGQANMTYPELGRQQFVYRTWPGELFTPVFMHTDYNWHAASWINACTGDKVSNSGSWPTCSVDYDTAGYHSDGINRPCSNETGSPWNVYSDPAKEACYHIKYVTLHGLADYYSNGQSFSGLGFSYWDEIDGIAYHSYAVANSPVDSRTSSHVLDHLHWHRDIAAIEDLKIIVTEYGPSGTSDIDDIRTFLQTNLGNYQGQYNNNPFKLMWFLGTGDWVQWRSQLFHDGTQGEPSGTLTAPGDGTGGHGKPWANDHGSAN